MKNRATQTIQFFELLRELQMNGVALFFTLRLKNSLHLAIFQHHARTREMPVEGFAMRLPARLKDVNEEASLSSIQHPVALFILSHFDILLFFAAIAILQLHLDHGHIARRIHIGREHFP